MRLRSLSTRELTAAQTEAIRSLLWAAFDSDDPEERFTEDDWQHAVGGTHVVIEEDDHIVAHAAVVPRELHVDGVPVRTGYVEAVATNPGHQGRGLGRRLMTFVNAVIREQYDLGALGTGLQPFYMRLGWETWLGPTSVRAAGTVRPTPEEDGYILILRTPTSPPLDLRASISCDWRPGDAW